MKPSNESKISLIRIERIPCRGRVVKLQINLSGEELFIFNKLFPADWLIHLLSTIIKILASESELNLHRLILVHQRQLGVQMDLSSSDLPEKFRN